MAKNIKITQVKSSAHAKQNMKDTLRHLVTAEEVD